MERKHAETICRDMHEDLFYPSIYDQFRRLAHALRLDYEHGELGTLFLPFETYRTPYRQATLLRTTNNTRAGAFRSAHQFGMAVDFVPNDNGRWSWDANKPWDELKRRAEACGLIVPMAWDRAHVESPLWADFRACLKAI